jgi:hypothetical protein
LPIDRKDVKAFVEAVEADLQLLYKETTLTRESCFFASTASTASTTKKSETYDVI